jgi:hypothetical protein
MASSKAFVLGDLQSYNLRDGAQRSRVRGELLIKIRECFERTNINRSKSLHDTKNKHSIKHFASSAVKKITMTQASFHHLGLLWQK